MLVIELFATGVRTQDDSLNGWDAARLRPPWLHSVRDIPAKLVDLPGPQEKRGGLLRPGKSKNFSTERAGYYSSSLSLLPATCLHRKPNQSQI